MVQDKFQNKIDALDVLKQQKADISSYIKELVSIYRIDSSIFTPDIWFDLVNIQKVDLPGDDSRLGILELRSKLRDEHNIKIEKLQNINEEIFLNNIDIILDKIKLIQKKLK